MATGARTLISKAKTYVGYREGAGNSNRFSQEMGRPAESWCADFIAAVARETGNADIIPNTASCSVAQEWYRSRGRLSEFPALGAQVFYGDSTSTYGPGGSHTEIVYAYDRDHIYTVGGNTNDWGGSEGVGVFKRTVSRHSNWTHSYGYPKYPEGIVGADKNLVNVYFGQEASEADIPAGGATTPPPAGTVTIHGFEYGPGAHGDHITYMGKCLVAAGCSRYAEGPGPTWGTADTESVRAYQLAIGDTDSADGLPGQAQLTKLETEHGQGLWPLSNQPAEPTPPPQHDPVAPQVTGIPGNIWARNDNRTQVKNEQLATIDVDGSKNGVVLDGEAHQYAAVTMSIEATMSPGSALACRYFKANKATGARTYTMPAARFVADEQGLVDAQFTYTNMLWPGEILLAEVQGKDSKGLDYTVSARTTAGIAW
ncbi:peptidoglycan-binding protein [Streptomyces sp. CBMA123]|uniref:peptidoglycan-binding protein n=1 Tax=Streptomyces sp. CBMA123 TaxID=1896313 RepID=UPI0016619020|nr:peptidoglycan-binding protein [Streptomyces sp. CBMA123]MBD0689645.1 hypothetical protein [Streptomyces sp. CBMA123]